MASHPDPPQSGDRPHQGQQIHEETVRPDHKTAAYSSTPNSNTTTAYEQPP